MLQQGVSVGDNLDDVFIFRIFSPPGTSGEYFTEDAVEKNFVVQISL